MDPSLLDQAQPILIIAVLAGLVIGALVFVGASRRASRANVAHTANAQSSPRAEPAVNRDPAPKRALSRDTRQRATNLIDDIARFYQDRHTG
jgi:flagellar basal body-associated protein FliL